MRLLAAHVALAFAIQTPEASVVGVVRDGETGLPISAVHIQLSDLNRATLSDQSGQYRLDHVPAGPQHVLVRAVGYGTRTLHALVPRSGSLQINVTLRPEPFPLEEIAVRPRVAVGRTDETAEPLTSERGLGMAAVRNHPLLAEADPLLALGGGAVAAVPESPEGIHLRGGAADQTAYEIDGIPVFSPYHGGGIFSGWDADALERVELVGSGPGRPDALAGTVRVGTRTPQDHLQGRGALSTTHGGVTLDGPLGTGGAGYLVGLRSGFPGLGANASRTTRLTGETEDALGTLTLPLAAGALTVLYYGSGNEIDAAALPADSVPSLPRNGFRWQNRSLGAGWMRGPSGHVVTIRAWHAEASATAVWNVSGSNALDLRSTRSDQGLFAEVMHDGRRGSVRLGTRLERSRTTYEVGTRATPAYGLGARTPVASLFGSLRRSLGSSLRADLGGSIARGAGSLYGSPSVAVSWQPSSALTLTAGFTRAHQFAQSLRNGESIVGRIFPADLFVGAGAERIPVARSDQWIAAADFRPGGGARLRGQVYRRTLEGLVLAAPGQRTPFVLDSLAVGSGTAQGVALDAEVSRARVGWIGSYAWQEVRFDHPGGSYHPEFSASHALESGIIAFPNPTSSIRLGMTALLGRRSTLIESGFEWEACNLIDGCEFVGSPQYSGDGLGTLGLPAYLRVDLGGRKHWHIRLREHDTRIGLYATVTNLLGRKNLLTYARDESGTLVGVDMRPLTPLVLGLDWTF